MVRDFYTWSGEPFVKEFLEKMGIDLGVIESGGSVACNLFSLAIMSKLKLLFDRAGFGLS